MSVVEKISSLLTDLSQKDLLEIKNRCSLLLKPERGPEDVIFDALCELVRTKIGKPEIPLSVFAKTDAYPAYKRGCLLVEKYVVGVIGTEKKIEMLKAYRVIIDATMHRIEAMKIPVTHSTVAKFLEQVYETMEQQFPGYAESGLMRVIINNHIQED